MKNEKWKSLRWVGVGVDVGVERGIKRETILRRHWKTGLLIIATGKRQQH